MRKKKVLFHSDYTQLKTGFGKNAKLVLSHLYKTGKYDLVQLGCGTNKEHPSFKNLPWKTIGTLPMSQKEIDEAQKDAKLFARMNYGAFCIDEIIKQEKPDVYIGVQDIWGLEYCVDRDWFNKITSVVWTTLDSRPILPIAVSKAPKIKNYWVWADFATKDLHKLGFNHVETVRGCLNEKDFFRYDDKYRSLLRKIFKIEQDAFVIGFVFRNQLRKSVPNLLKGYVKFKKQLPKDKKTYLLLHTNFDEGWNIMKLAEENGIDKKEILTTYNCSACGAFLANAFAGEQQKCPFCQTEKTLNTTSVGGGVTEYQLNEIYNLMDVYCHPFTSGGQEIPIQEAKLTELITLVTNYSCGEDSCAEEAHSLPLTWHEYREAGTEFIKASTDSDSISQQLLKVYFLTEEERVEIGKKGRQWVIDNFSVEKIGQRVEKLIDSAPFFEGELEIKQKQNPDAEVDISLPENEWLTSLYRDILAMNVDENDDGFKYWKEQLAQDQSDENGPILNEQKRKNIDKYFRKVALGELEKASSLKDYVDEDDERKKILYVIPESAGDVYMATSLFKNLKKTYPDYDLYVSCKPEYRSILDGNPYIYKHIPYFKECEDHFLMEGQGNHKGFFDILFLSHMTAQRHANYTHNGKDKIMFDLKSF